MKALPQVLIDKMFSFQGEGIQYGLTKHGRFLLGDEMGVGKTL